MPPTLKRWLSLCAAGWLAAFNLLASDQQGLVTFGGLPVPGATVTAIQGERKLSTITNQLGAYSFPDLADGVWAIDVDMPGFGSAKRDVTVAAGATAQEWQLKVMTL